MSDKARKWTKSKVNVDQVNQNTKNAQQFVELTEKYKTLGSQIEAKIDVLFNFLGTHFMSFDPNLTIQQELEKSGQTEQIKALLMKTALPKGLDFKSTIAPDLENYARTLLNDKYQAIVLAASEPDFFAKRNADYWTRSQDSARHIEAKLKEEPTNSRLEKAEDLLRQYSSISQDYMSELLKGANLSPVKMVKTYLKSVKDSMEKLDPCNIDQLKAALTILDNPKDKQVLEEWVKKTEVRDFFLKTTEELHDAYDAFLELDTRTGTKTKDSVTEKITNFLSGVKAFVTGEKVASTPAKEEAKVESPSLFQKFFSGIFGAKEEAKPAPQVDTDEVEEDIDLDSADSKEVAVHNTQSSPTTSKVVKTMAVEAYESLEQVHKEYQTILSALIDAKKVTCFNNVMQATKMASSCLIRKPFEQAAATDDNKLDCATYDAKAKMGMAECDFIFPFATDSDDIISEFLIKSSKVEVNIYENGQTGLKSHVDEVVADLTIALGQAVLANYKALPAGSNQEMMQAAYNKPLDQGQAEKGTLKIADHDENFPHDNANALVQHNALPAPQEQDIV